MDQDLDPSQFEKFISKFGLIILTIFAAIIGKISNQITINKPITFISVFAVAGLSFFYGVLAGLFCEWRGYSTVPSSIIIGVVVYLSEKINNYINANIKAILDGFLDLLFKIINRKNDGSGNTGN